MSNFEREVHKLIISLCFSLVTWTIVNLFIVDISFWKFLIVELLLFISWKFSIFTTRKMKL
jgi:hypothetical protein